MPSMHRVHDQIYSTWYKNMGCMKKASVKSFFYALATRKKRSVPKKLNWT